MYSVMFRTKHIKLKLNANAEIISGASRNKGGLFFFLWSHYHHWQFQHEGLSGMDEFEIALSFQVYLTNCQTSVTTLSGMIRVM